MTFPLRLIGDEHDPSHVIVELSGTVDWSGKGGWMEGITFRRPRMATDQNGEILRVHNGGRVDTGVCVLDNEGSQGPVAVIADAKSRGEWFSTDLKGSEGGAGVMVESGASLKLQNVSQLDTVKNQVQIIESRVSRLTFSLVNLLVYHHEQPRSCCFLQWNRLLFPNERLSRPRKRWRWCASRWKRKWPTDRLPLCSEQGRRP